MVLICLSCAWVAGVFLGARFSLNFLVVMAGLTPLLLLIPLPRYKKPIILASLCLLLLLCGIFRFQSTIPSFDENHLHFYNESGTVEIKGVVIRAPEEKDKTTHLRLSTEAIKVNNEWRNISGTVLIFAPRYISQDYGDVLKVTGKLETPPQLGDFDYKTYLAHQGIYATMLYPHIETLEIGRGIKPLSWVHTARNRLSRILAKILPEPQASLAQGIILGIRGTIPQSIKDNLSLSGTAHLLAISGLNLGIVAGIMLAIGIWLFGKRRYLYAWLAIGTVWLYSLLTGMQPPVVRGAIMASLFLTAEILGRQRNAITSLVFAAAVMVGITPQVLWDASFQMSFLAMTGLIFITPPLMSLGRAAISRIIGEEGTVVALARVVTDSFSVTIGAIVAVWPVIAYYFGIISFVGPVATLLAAPALPAIIVLGILTASIGIIALPLAKILGWAVWLFTSYMLLIANGFASLPVSHAELTSFDNRIFWIYYFVLALAIWASSKKQFLAHIIPQLKDKLKAGAMQSASFASVLPGKWLISPLLVIAILVSFTAATMPDNDLHISFLDVGEGDAILIQTPTHQDILIDGGPNPRAVCLGLSQRMPFWDRTVDLVVLTHPHTDHLTGLIEVLRRYEVKQVLAPELDYTSPLYDEWHRLIKEEQIPCTIAQAETEIKLGQDTSLKVLNPPSEPLAGTESDIDNNGMVLRLEKGEVSFLLTADIMQEAEMELVVRRACLTSTVLKVAHHGSDTSTTAEFLAVVNPPLAVISTGKDNRFGHPSNNVLNRLGGKLSSDKIYRTDRFGTIEFITDGERLWVKKER